MADNDGKPTIDVEGATSIEGADKRRKTQHCTFCKNHGVAARKKGHICLYKTCDCSLCDLQKKAQVTMRHQQRVWRHQKQMLHHMSKDSRIQDEKSQVCDKCRNHNILTMKKNHYCPYDNCHCDYCSLTCKRRELMKHLQRVRRCNLTSDASETKHMIRAFELEGKLSEKQLNAISKGRDLALLDPDTLADGTHANKCSGSSLEYCPSKRYQGSTKALADSEYEINDVFLPPLLIRTASPPPLIPLTLSPPDSPDNCNTPSSSPTASPPEGLRAHQGSPPSLYPLYSDKEKRNMASSVSVLTQIRRFSLNTTSLPSVCISSSRQPLRFGIDPEDLYLRHCNWPPSPSISDPAVSISSLSPSSAASPIEKHHKQQNSSFSNLPECRVSLHVRGGESGRSFNPYRVAVQSLRSLEPQRAPLKTDSQVYASCT